MDPFVAREWSAPATDSSDVGWDRRRRPRRSPPPRRMPHVPEHHPRRLLPSLADLAARVVAANIQNLDSSHLRGLSPRALQLALKHLDLESISLSTWRVFQQLGRAGHLETRSTQALHRFHQHIESPTADLSVYLKPLQSHDFAFISHLRIAGSCLVKAEELLYLPRWCKNLGLLELVEPSNSKTPFPRLSDRLIKAWSLDGDSFPKLKGIRLSTHRSITERSLQHLTQFPALTMLDITAGKQEWVHSKSLARALGWVHCDWIEAVTCDDDRDDEVSLESHQCWLQLSLKIHRLLVGPTRPIDLSAPRNVRRLDIYSILDMPALRMLQQPRLADAPLSSNAMASLTLGEDSEFLTEVRGSLREERKFFWRYWQDDFRFPLPSEEQGQKSASQKSPPVTERPYPSSAATIRSRKKRKAVNLSEALSQFKR
ncbi:hypothetical protein N8I77_003247 [Diaporthe amygdali]|uniref:Uncharacterized protein n=1 Tax=Phomopsis amygdali TaxID=1214568 RepID=A0AAD9W7G9_PHOAM|nr:hypothetical protein N8I77_003247 [Diaporthe amygdali]